MRAPRRLKPSTSIISFSTSSSVRSWPSEVTQLMSPSALARNDPGLLVKSDPRHTRGSADSGVRQERRDPPGCATDVAAVVN